MEKLILTEVKKLIQDGRAEVMDPTSKPSESQFLIYKIKTNNFPADLTELL